MIFSLMNVWRKNKKRAMILGFLVLVAVVASSSLSKDNNGSAHTDVVNVVVIGATGDLAKKYLWQGFFNLVQEESRRAFHIFAGARTSQDDGEREIRTILENNVSCSKLPRHVQETSDDDCEAAKSAFRDSVPYYQLKKPENYAALCKDIQRKMQSVGLQERGKMFYLSVPPFAYADIAASINRECRPVGGAWLRVVLEKPFGRDSGSAKELSKALKVHLQEKEIYRIDHYLGKTGVQSILPFREMNKKKYGDMWNRENVDRVEIVMKETLDAKGRISFYDKYGVIRDVLQNHLTEMMALIAMEIPSNLSNIHDHQREKLAMLSQVDHLTSQHALIGQYQSYNEEWRDELGKGDDEASSVPTFAAVLLSISSPRWSGVPFLMVAGKSLDQKLAYVRVVFKNAEFCSVTPNYDEGDHACQSKQIIFFIGSAKLPTIAVSKSLPKPEIPSTWTVQELEPDMDILGSPARDFYVYRAGEEKDAYSALIRECYHGNRDKFVGTAELTASWDIWTPVLRDLEEVQPRSYPRGVASGRWLDLQIKEGTLRFVHHHDDEWDVANSQRLGIPSMSGLTKDFRSDPLYTGSAEETVEFLARHLLASAKTAIQERGVFHVAFPGGKTPEQLFLHLFLRMRHLFPWKDTHIWFTDERCVALTARESNFQVIESKLLKYVPVPFTSIHPMPVHLANGLCSSSDNGAQIYAAEMRRLLPDSRLDYVVLGVGGDGHVASLFPHQEPPKEGGQLVVLSEAPRKSRVSNRMTLTYAAINSARAVAIHILGEEKHRIVDKFKHGHMTDKSELPVLGVNLKEGNLTWFIDHGALL